MKNNPITEYVLEHKTKGDLLFIAYDAKVVALIEKCTKTHVEYLESKRGHIFSDSWYKRAIEQNEKLLDVLEPYVTHGFEHVHDAVMLREKLSSKVLDIKTLPPTIDLTEEYHRVLLMLINCYTDLGEEEARAQLLETLHNFAELFYECYERQHSVPKASPKKSQVVKDKKPKK